MQVTDEKKNKYNNNYGSSSSSKILADVRPLKYSIPIQVQ